MRFSKASRWVALGLAVGIAVGSMLRETSLGETLHIHGGVHVAVHCLVFACLTALLTASIRSPWMRLLFFLGVVLLGLGTEYYESLHDGYPLEKMDVLDDTLGAAAGLLVGEVTAWAGSWMWRRRRVHAWESRGEGV